MESGATTHPRADPLAAIGRAAVVPVIRAEAAAEALELAHWLAGEGLEVIELTASTPGWEDAVHTLRGEQTGLAVGVGTVRHPDAARRAAAAGADFLVTPHTVAGLREAAGEVPVIEGGFTPGEVLAAADHGVAKLFPAHVGGPRYLRSLLAIEPAARIVPTGGVALEDVPEWLAAGAFAVGVGGGLEPSARTAEQLARLREERP